MALYPPIVASSMQPFTGNSAKIYFNIPEYNSRSEIKHVQITVKRQSSNISVVKNSSGIIIRGNLQQDEIDRQTSSLRYYVVINNSEIKDNGFKKDVLYKVQLRFSSIK